MCGGGEGGCGDEKFLELNLCQLPPATLTSSSVYTDLSQRGHFTIIQSTKESKQLNLHMEVAARKIAYIKFIFLIMACVYLKKCNEDIV